MLSAVEKHNVSGVGLKQIGAALHGQRALHHTEKLHFAVPVTIKRVKAVFASNAVVHHGHQRVAVAAGLPHAVKLIFVRKTHLLFRLSGQDCYKSGQISGRLSKAYRLYL